ncbi:hypothetical protein [Persicirhabdus sediminis]|uniref:Uncharacterized protein n=1 Tax=Persicirhabdus sediminis TaxID=454144 RepID=A0A8J7SL40_9BACT|nr:hypothetical protein [Persicirhabdus sediminis]MBK1792131.1 hypothetical protein [Persicirhabdus sediminis]
MDNTENDQTVNLICVRCGEANDERASRCEHCKAPLDDFASTAPWEMGKVTAGRTAANPRTNPIVFWGVWLLFSPTVVIAGYSFVSHLTYAIVGPDDSYTSGGYLLAGLMAGLYFLIGGWALYTVTKRFFSKKKASE